MLKVPKLTRKRELRGWGVPARVAKMLGVPRSTLTSAMSAGHVQAAKLGCGTVVARISSAQTWAASDRQPGRPPKEI